MSGTVTVDRRLSEGHSVHLVGTWKSRNANAPPPRIPEPATLSDVSGKWIFAIDQLAGDGVTCKMSPNEPYRTFMFRQSGQELSGEYSDFTFLCHDGSLYQKYVIYSSGLLGVVGEPNQKPRSVSLKMYGESWQQDGTLHGETMDGTVTFDRQFPGKPHIHLVGKWTAQFVRSTSASESSDSPNETGGRPLIAPSNRPAANSTTSAFQAIAPSLGTGDGSLVSPRIPPDANSITSASPSISPPHAIGVGPLVTPRIQPAANSPTAASPSISPPHGTAVQPVVARRIRPAANRTASASQATAPTHGAVDRPLVVRRNPPAADSTVVRPRIVRPPAR